MFLRPLKSIILISAFLSSSLVFAQPTSRELFDDTVVHDIFLEVNPQDWATLKATFDQNTYYSADVFSNGENTYHVGIRSRGGGSRSGEKPNLDINIDKYFKGQTFAGLSFFMLKANNQDGSLLHEALTMKLFRRFGLPAPREAPARLYINREYFGMYTLVEKLDEDFLDRNFGEDKGDLYEYQPDYDFRFQYLGSDPALYQPLLDPKINGKSIQNFVDMVAAINNSSDADFISAITPYLDPKLYLAHAAIENVLTELDGLWADTYGMNNFFLYRFNKSKKFQFIVWDKDLTFRWADRPIFNNAMDNVLARRLLAIPEYRNAYLTDVQKAADLMGGPGGWAETELNRMYNLIAVDARNDPHKQCIFNTGAIGPCGPDQFEKDVDAMHSFLAFRSNFVKAELAAAGVQLPSSDPIVDTVAPVEAQSPSPVAPGSIVHISGARFGSSTSADFEPYDRIQGNTYVVIDGVRAPILAASANSIDVQIPWDIPFGPNALVVIVDGAVSLSKQVDVADAAPYILAVVHADGSLVSKQSPVRPGEILIVYASGLGAVDAVVELLQVGEVGRVHPLHHLGRDLRHRAQSRDHARQQDHREVGLVALNARVLQRQDFVGRGGQAHHAFAVQVAVGIHIAQGQRELVFGLEHHALPRVTRARRARSSRSSSRARRRCPWR